MPLFTYRCPNTGRLAQGFTAEDISADTDIYEVVRCVLCRQVHRVNPANDHPAQVEGSGPRQNSVPTPKALVDVCTMTVRTRAGGTRSGHAPRRHRVRGGVERDVVVRPDRVADRHEHAAASSSK